MAQVIRTIIIAAALVAVGVAVLLWWTCGGTNARVRQEARTVMSPTMVESITSIGEWEFLSISDEELVDTVRRGFFGDDELVRIYYGTVRLGIDLSSLRADWVRTEGDSLVCTLPPVRLLDENFIDETRTVSFHESGTWTAKDRAALYDRAYHRMRARCVTEAYLRRTEENARLQFQSLMRAMGYPHTKVEFEKR